MEAYYRPGMRVLESNIRSGMIMMTLQRSYSHKENILRFRLPSGVAVGEVVYPVWELRTDGELHDKLYFNIPTVSTRPDTTVARRLALRSDIQNSDGTWRAQYLQRSLTFTNMFATTNIPCALRQWAEAMAVMGALQHQTYANLEAWMYYAGSPLNIKRLTWDHTTQILSQNPPQGESWNKRLARTGFQLASGTNDGSRVSKHQRTAPSHRPSTRSIRIL